MFLSSLKLNYFVSKLWAATKPQPVQAGIKSQTNMILNCIEGIYFLINCSAYYIGLYSVYVFMFKCHGSPLTLSADWELYKNSVTKTAEKFLNFT